MTNSLLLQEELKRIGFVMNYDSKKLVSENTETTKNLIVENKIEALFTPKTSNEVISEITLKQIFKEVWDKRQNLISEQWVRGADQIGYWKVLFDQLTKGGIGVKWQVANDPVKSTNMYWGPWVIWKDTTKNGGWPITFTTADKKLYSFKFQGGKYAGQPVNNIKLESKEINAIFDLSQWGKVTGAVGGPQLANLMKTKSKSGAAAAACKTVDGKPIPANQIPAVAKQIFDELAYAFDGVGTYEAEAVAAYQKITCKPILHAVNAKVAARGMKGIKNVGDWAKDEMSDYDYDQYRKIWANLQKLGYKAPPVSQGMRAAGVVGNVTGINSIEKGTEGLQQLFSGDYIKGFEKIVDAVRSFLGGVVGGVVTTILDFTGIGKVVTSIGWGIMLVFDIILSTIKGVPKIVEILLDIVNILTTGSVGAAVGRVLKPFMGTGSKLSTIIKQLGDIPWLKAIFETIEKGLGKVSSMVSSAIKWIMGSKFWKWLSGTAVGKAIGSVSTKVVAFFDDFTKILAEKGGAGSMATTTRSAKYQLKTGQQKIKDKLTKDAAENLAWEEGAIVGDEIGGETGKKLVKLAKTTKALTGSGAGIDKTGKKIDLQRANKLSGQNIGQDVGKLSSVSSTTAKAIGTVGKETVKTGQNIYNLANDSEEKNKKTYTKPDLSKLNRDTESTNVVRQPA